MPEKPSRKRDKSLEAALEKTAHAGDFNAEGLRREMEDTDHDSGLEQTPQQYLRVTASDGTGGAQAELTVTADITSFEESSQIPVQLRFDANDSAARYQVVNEVGAGATSRVYAVHDRGLNRTIAVKFLKRSREGRAGVRQRFLHEARVTAMLEHPNVMPVHDIGVSPQGEVYFTMKNIAGRTLGDAIRATKAGERRGVPSEFRSFDGRVRIFLKVCDALAYAHNKGFVHQDVKPDNIMMGEYGEVLLLDWGSALATVEQTEVGQGRALYGTPAYMSPEQARRGKADERSDVYCLGATFFHALLLRHPTWADSADRFWEKKRAGTLDLPTDTERRTAPAALIDIALKALAADPSQRYRSVREFADELKRWQSGEKVQAHRESLVERFLRWYRRNRRVFWVSLVSVLAVSGVAGLLFREKIQELLTWRLVFSDDFSTATTAGLGRTWESYGARNWWTPAEREEFSDSGAWRVEQGGISGQCTGVFNNLTWRKPIAGDIRVDWEYTALLVAANLNCYLAGRTRWDGYRIHVGAFGDPRSVRLTKGSRDQVLARAALAQPIDTGTAYRFRMEKEGRRVRFWVNGRRLIDCLDPVDISGVGHQTFGFENNNDNRVRIDNVKVYHHPLPLKVSPVASADRLFELGYYREALQQYGEIVQAYPGRDVAGVAAYKSAMCLLQLDSLRPALEAFDAYERANPRHELVPLAVYQRALLLERLADTSGAEACFALLGTRHRRSPLMATVLNDFAALRSDHLVSIMSTWVYDSSDHGANARWTLREAQRIQSLQEATGIRLQPCPFMIDACATLHLSGAYRLDEVAGLFRWERTEMARQYLNQGMYERVVDAYPDQMNTSAEASLLMGRYDEVFGRFARAENRWLAQASVAAGRAEETLRLYPRETLPCAMALAGLGRFDTLLAAYGGADSVAPQAAYSLGRLPAYLAHWSAPELVFYDGWGRLAARPDTVMAVMGEPARWWDVAEWIQYGRALVWLDRSQDFLRLASTVPGMEATCVEALLALGRPEDALVKYPRFRWGRHAAHKEMGEFDSALQAYPYRTLSRIDIRLAQGRDAEVLAEFPRRPQLCAAVLLGQGRLAEVVEKYPEQRRQAAHALLLLGRYDELLRRYPEQRDLCAHAYYRQGKPEEALERYPESRAQYARYLLDHGRAQDVVQRFPDQTWECALALTLLGRFAEVPYGRGLVRVCGKEYCQLLHLAALLSWQRGDRRGAHALFGQPHLFYRSDRTSPRDWWTPLRFGELLLPPLLRALDGDTAGLRAACVRIMREHRNQYSRRLWYEAAFLADSVTDEQFMAQPYRRDASGRLLFLRALRDDVGGQTGAALDGYRRCLSLPFYPQPVIEPSLLGDEVVKRFMDWRVKVLGREPGEGLTSP